MLDISNIEIAVLGLLFEHHHYAYRLEEIMEKRSMSKWVDLKYSSIDDVLKNLENKELIKKETKKNNDKPINVYFITDNGRTVFLDKIKELISTRSKFAFPIDLAISNMYFLKEEEVIESLNKYLNSVEEDINFFENFTKIQKENNVPFNYIAILSHSLAHLKAEKQWIKEFIKEIK